MSLPHDLITPSLTLAVLDAMDAAVESEVMPRWRALEASEIRSKTHEWDLVTDADEGAERLLTSVLRGFIDIPVVGEEATSKDPSLMDLVGSTSCWLVDPVDGTRNFVAGHETFACMVALIDRGLPIGAWITYPAVGRKAWALAGQGAFLDDAPLTTPAPSPEGGLRGAIGARLFLGEGEALMERAATLGEASPIRYCAGWDYLDVLTGATDYVSFSRSLPWDHAPGSLICNEAGLMSKRPEGDAYYPGDGRAGILTAHPSVWDKVASTLHPVPAA